MLQLKAVETLPAGPGKRHDLQGLIAEFANSKEYIMEVCYTVGIDYSTADVCRACLANAITRSRRYGIKVLRRGNRVFLIKAET